MKKPKKRKGLKFKPNQWLPQELSIPSPDSHISELAQHVAQEGGQVLSLYREPLGGHVHLLVALPLDRVEPTPFQRDVSDAHVRRLTVAMDRMRRYLDPIIVVRANGKYYTPNGNHRLTAMKEISAKSIIAILVPDPKVAYQILAMNIEKAHNLREKSLEVYRMYTEIARLAPDQKESDFSLEFEEPQLITLGFAYQLRPRLSGGAYQPALKRVDGFLAFTFKNSLTLRQKRAELLIELDNQVVEVVQVLKGKGLVSPLLKPFVVSRINPLRFMKDEMLSFEDLIEAMLRRAKKFNTEKIKIEDLTRAGGGVFEGDAE